MNKQVTLKFLKEFISDYIMFTSTVSVAIVIFALIKGGVLLEFLVKMGLFTAFINAFLFLMTWFIKRIVSIAGKENN